MEGPRQERDVSLHQGKNRRVCTTREWQWPQMSQGRVPKPGDTVLISNTSYKLKGPWATLTSGQLTANVDVLSTLLK